MSELAAVLFDMDGTLIHSEHDWHAAEAALAQAYGAKWTEADAESVFGKPLPVTARLLIDRGVDLDEASVIEFMVEHVANAHRRGVGWLPGAEELLIACAEGGIATAVVSASPRRLITGLQEMAPAGTLTVAVGGDEVRHGKPDPESYLLAAERLGVDPQRCVAVEDSANGAQAGMAATGRLLAVPSSIRNREVMASRGYAFADSLQDVTVDLLRRLRAAEAIETSGAPTGRRQP